MKNLEDPKIFFKNFIKIFRKRSSQLKCVSIKHKEWTGYIEEIIDILCGKEYYKGGHHKSKLKSVPEFLKIDFNLFRNNKDYYVLDNGNIPLISIEHENEAITIKNIKKKEHRLFYTFNKLFALTSKLKVLIGYIKIKGEYSQEEKLRIEELFIKKIAKYIKNTPLKYFPHQNAKFLIILGYEEIEALNEDYSGYVVYENGDYTKIRK